MNYTFFLKQPKIQKVTLILFSCYFKLEGKKFIYSTGEKINPVHWDKDNKYPIERGKKRSSDVSMITLQLDRYKNVFKETEANCVKTREEFTSQILRTAFDEEFKRAPGGKNLFFDSYDEFMAVKNNQWSKSTVKRYNNVKNLLQNFEKEKNYKITFSTVNESFEAKFYNYCIHELKKPHVDNTYSRNIGFLVTFMHWAIKKKYTYNQQYKTFYRPKETAKEHVIMDKKDIEVLMAHNCKTKSEERIRDVFVFECMTGLRFSELKFINKSNVVDGYIKLKEQKEISKETRNIPLNDLSGYILKKYNYRLPLVVSQRHNEVIKDILEDAGFTRLVEITEIRDKTIHRMQVPFYTRVSSHTARRSFITLLKENEIPDKLIAKITGHRDLKILNRYYQVREKHTKKAVMETFDINFSR